MKKSRRKPEKKGVSCSGAAFFLVPALIALAVLAPGPRKPARTKRKKRQSRT